MVIPQIHYVKLLVPSFADVPAKKVQVQGFGSTSGLMGNGIQSSSHIPRDIKEIMFLSKNLLQKTDYYGS